MRHYVIWASDPNAWWAPLERGYVKSLREAGRFTLTEVATILDRDCLGEQVVMTADNAEHHGTPNAVRPHAS